jgi:hypothetical protein
MQPSDPDTRPTDLDAGTAHGREQPGQVLRYSPKTGERHLTELVWGLLPHDTVHFDAQMPAKNASGRVPFKANQMGGREPSGITSFSEKLVNGTTQRLSTPSHCRQCTELTLRIFVTPGSVFFSAPRRIRRNDRPGRAFEQ